MTSHVLNAKEFKKRVNNWKSETRKAAINLNEHLDFGEAVAVQRVSFEVSMPSFEDEQDKENEHWTITI